MAKTPRNENGASPDATAEKQRRIQGEQDQRDASKKAEAGAKPQAKGAAQAGERKQPEKTPPEKLKLRLQGKGPVGFVDGEVTLSLARVDEGTSMAYSADVQVGGQIARLGQRMISGVTREMAGQFFTAFERWREEAPEEKVAAPPAQSFFQLVWRLFLRLVGLRKDD